MQLTIHVVTVSLSSLELLGVLLPLHVMLSQAYVLTTTIVRLNSALVPLVKLGVQHPMSVLLFPHVVLLTTLVVTVCLSSQELLGVLLHPHVTTCQQFVLTTTTVRLNSVFVNLEAHGVTLNPNAS